MFALSQKEIKRRSKEMSELSRRISFEKNRSWLGWEGIVLFDERGKGESWMGRNFAYKPIVVKSGESLAGRFVPVRVVNTFTTYLEAEVS
jgi:tRNA A37 methylthiotransferase MiaB